MHGKLPIFFYIFILSFLLYYRGPSFRKEYAHLSEIRSIVCKSVNIMALSATVSPAMKNEIMESLNMPKNDSVVIKRVPNKPNIKYAVQISPEDIREILSPVISDIRANRLHAKKMIIFCRDFNEIDTSLVSALYGCEALTPLIAPNDGNQPICQMFSASTEEKVKNDILVAFTNPQSSLRIVVATIAFGMGIDAPNIEKILHYGPSDSIESYIQETARCGCDGRDSLAILHYRKRDITPNRTVSDTMKMYVGNTGYCRRKLLMRVFETMDEITFPSPIHKCCDICERDCSCQTCTESSPVVVASSLLTP